MTFTYLPRKAVQRSQTTAENTNGLLRQYFPKGTDLSGFTQEELDAVAWRLNTRPRKSMGWKCPAGMFTPEAFDFKEHHASLFALAH
jgi:IS30 family transposase